MEDETAHSEVQLKGGEDHGDASVMVKVSGVLTVGREWLDFSFSLFRSAQTHSVRRIPAHSFCPTYYEN